jgi:hypothetical protein
MNLQELAVLLLIASVAAIIGRALAGYSLSGCLISFILSSLGAVGGWLIQGLLRLPDGLARLPWLAEPRPVSVIGASVGALLLAFIGGLLGRPVQRPSRTRYRR